MTQVKTKTQQNIEFVWDLYNKGVEQIHKTRLPYPEKTQCLNRANVPVLAITDNGLVLIYENPALRQWRNQK